MALVGVEGHLVEVEADLGVGVPSFSLVGLPDASLAESRDRVRAAMVNSGQHWPADQAGHGQPVAGQPAQARLELRPGIAAACWPPQEVVPAHVFDDAVLLGELGLDGRVRPVRGVLPAVARGGAGRGTAAWSSRRRNAAEAALVPGLRVTGVRTLADLVARARGERAAGGGAGRGAAPVGCGADEDDPAHRPDLADVLGQADAARTCSRWPRPAATTC